MDVRTRLAECSGLIKLLLYTIWLQELFIASDVVTQDTRWNIVAILLATSLVYVYFPSSPTAVTLCRSVPPYRDRNSIVYIKHEIRPPRFLLLNQLIQAEKKTSVYTRPRHICLRIPTYLHVYIFSYTNQHVEPNKR